MMSRGGCFSNTGHFRFLAVSTDALSTEFCKELPHYSDGE